MIANFVMVKLRRWTRSSMKKIANTVRFLALMVVATRKS